MGRRLRKSPRSTSPTESSKIEGGLCKLRSTLVIIVLAHTISCHAFPVKIRSGQPSRADSLGLHVYGDWALHRLRSFNNFDQHYSADISSYYIRTLLDNSPEPLLLTPKSEVHALFVEIFETLGVHADFPDVWSHPGFDIGFQEEEALGRATLAV